MEVINFSERPSVLNQYMAELRDKKYQQNRDCGDLCYGGKL